jgi:hypothetical protein
VTDQSWALINSVLEIFNNCSVSQYIDWAYEIFVEKKDKFKLMPINLCICSVHFFKKILKKVKKVKADKVTIDAFLFSFTYLQNSFTIEQFHSNLVDIFICFSQKYLNASSLNAMKSLKKKISELKVINRLETDLKKSTDIHHPDDQDFININTEIPVRQDSRFVMHFDQLLKSYQQTLDQNETQKNRENSYYSPELFPVISD